MELKELADEAGELSAFIGDRYGIPDYYKAMDIAIKIINCNRLKGIESMLSAIDDRLQEIDGRLCKINSNP